MIVGNIEAGFRVLYVIQLGALAAAAREILRGQRPQRTVEICCLTFKITWIMPSQIARAVNDRDNRIEEAPLCFGPWLQQAVPASHVVAEICGALLGPQQPFIIGTPIRISRIPLDAILPLQRSEHEGEDLRHLARRRPPP